MCHCILCSDYNFAARIGYILIDKITSVTKRWSMPKLMFLFIYLEMILRIQNLNFDWSYIEAMVTPTALWFHKNKFFFSLQLCHINFCNIWHLLKMCSLMTGLEMKEEKDFFIKSYKHKQQSFDLFLAAGRDNFTPSPPSSHSSPVARP